VALKEAEAEQIPDAVAVEGNGGVPVEVLEGVGLVEAGPLEAVGEVLSVAALDLVTEREFEVSRNTEIYAVGRHPLLRT
jgi:hypothetical protein